MGATTSKPSETLTMEEIRTLTTTFKAFDADNTGTIDTDELEKVLVAMGLRPTAEELRQMLDDMDADGSGTIDLDEFLATMAKKSTGVEKEIKMAFHVFDANGRGYLTPDDVSAAFKSLGEVLTHRQLRRLLRAAGADEHGRVQFQGFADMLRKKIKDDLAKGKHRSLAPSIT